MDNEVLKKYGDIIDLPHHESKNFHRMGVLDRAAQFSPFAALTGHSDNIKEEARITCDKIILSDEEQKSLNEKFLFIKNNISSKPFISIFYFIPDQRKEGGAYKIKEGNIIKLKEFEKTVVFDDGEQINFDAIYDIKGEIVDDVNL